MDSNLDRSGGAAARVMAEKPCQDNDRDLFGISELAEEFGVTTRTIRFYENKALLTPQRVGGARVFTRKDRARLALILRAKAIGASLAEIAHFLDLYGEGGEGRRDQLEYLVNKTADAIADLERKKTLIDDTLNELRIMNEQASSALGQL
jgi:DNA-binding transcriptional MerR regulator